MSYSPLKPDSGPSPNLDIPQIQTNFSQYGTIFAQNHVALNGARQGDHTFVVLDQQGFNVSNVVAGMGLSTITTATDNDFVTGQTVVMTGLVGTTDLNGIPYVIIVINATTFTVPFATAFAYVSGGYAVASVDPGVNNNFTALYPKNVTAATGGTKPQLFIQVPQFLPTDNDSRAAPNLGMQITCNQVNTSGPQYQSFLPGGYLIYWGTTTNIATPITLSPAPSKILVAVATPNTMTTAGNGPFDASTTITSASTFKINSSLNFGGSPISYSFGWYAIGAQ